MQRNSFLPIHGLVLALTLAIAACGGADDSDPRIGGAGGSGGDDVGAGGTGGDGGGSTVTPIEECEKPRVDALDPDRGPPGMDIFLVGECFNPIDLTKNTVIFSSESASGASSGALEVAEDGSRLKVRVPNGAITGPIKISTNWGAGPVTIDGPVFEVTDDAPIPKISTITPDAITAGADDTVIMISGSGFVGRSKLLIDGEEIEAEVESAVSIRTTLSAAKLASTGSFQFQVVTSPPGGGESNEVPLSVVAPINVVSAVAVSPVRVIVGFDQPVDRNSIGGRRNSWRITREGGGELSVRDVDPVAGNPRAVSLTTTNQSPTGRYTVIAQESVRSRDGGAIRERSASFRGFGAPPLEVDTIGGATGDACGAAAINGPTGITLVDGTFHVVETEGHQVQLIDADGTFGGFLGHDGTSSGLHTGAALAAGCPGDGSDLAGAFSGPRGQVVAVGARTWVADTGNDRILLFEDGKDTVEFAQPVGWEKPVILGMAQDRIWIANGADGKVYRLQTSGLMSDGLLFGPGSHNGQFDFALDAGGVPAMAVNPTTREAYITDPGNHRVQKFGNYTDPRGWVGKGSDEFRTIPYECAGTAEGCATDERGAFTNPRGIAIDGNGSIWVIDEGEGGRVQRFSATGYITNGTYVLGYMPAGISFDEDGFMWIVEADTGVLHKYEI